MTRLTPLTKIDIQNTDIRYKCKYWQLILLRRCIQSGHDTLICCSIQTKIYSGRPLGQPALFLPDKKTGRRQTGHLYLRAQACSVSSSVLTQHPRSAFIYLPLAGHCPACTFVIGVASSRKRAISWSAQSVGGKKM